jgi:hypothetical protein
LFHLVVPSELWPRLATPRVYNAVLASKPIIITVSAGTRFLGETLILGPEDSDAIWEAPQGEHPVISGGRLISDWTKSAGAAWKADAPGPYFHQLFVDGRRATRARTPNNGFFRIDGASSQNKAFQLRYRGNKINKERLAKTMWKSSRT